MEKNISPPENNDRKNPRRLTGVNPLRHAYPWTDGFEMKWIEAKVTFEHSDHQQMSDLIVGVFVDLGLQGAVVEDPQTQPAEDWAEGAVTPPADHAVIGYFASDGQLESRCRELEDEMARLQRALGLSFRIDYRAVDDENWAESWKAFFDPLKIGRQIVVKPSWREYCAAPGEIVLELDPGMAFGTGTHPTTVLCIKMIERFLRRGDSFLDIGTGSGILLLAAARLGASRLWGIDKDETAVAVAEGNLVRNSISKASVHLQAGDLIEEVHTTFDVVVANILTPVIQRLIADLGGVIQPGGIFICSGMTLRDREGIRQELEKSGFETVEERSQEDWLAIAARRHATPERGPAAVASAGR
jgi:ribosomal protein L11 methyltransferase